MQDSKSISFLDESRNFSVHVLDGQKLINELAIIHNVSGEGFNFFREIVLSAVHLSSFLKNKEGLGFFIDSEVPYFRFKIELNAHGTLRTLLLPANFDEFPQAITGRLRISKVLPQSKTPYTSLIELNQTPLGEVVNSGIKDSYQTEVLITVSEQSDHGLMFIKFPSDEEKSLEDYKNEYNQKLLNLCNQYRDDQQGLIKGCENLGLHLLAQRDIKFKCNCSRERMLLGLKDLLKSNSIEDIFAGDEHVELKCDYCHTSYQILRSEL